MGSWVLSATQKQGKLLRLPFAELEFAQIIIIVVVVTVMLVVVVCLLSHYKVSTRSFIQRPGPGRRPGEGPPREPAGIITFRAACARAACRVHPTPGPEAQDPVAVQAGSVQNVCRRGTCGLQMLLCCGPEPWRGRDRHLEEAPSDGPEVEVGAEVGLVRCSD
ncbi:hypothetical protein H920_11673 [Fukomys damarensis]|uniref:Uncharacterized protein n=1 Tax=Fukomys damarensis TaxID=885580 RepID=A0A091D8T8_FUKDA|nr:hypothetical protein H920_11673 [Fukomys damarensis]